MDKADKEFVRLCLCFKLATKGRKTSRLSQVFKLLLLLRSIEAVEWGISLLQILTEFHLAHIITLYHWLPLLLLSLPPPCLLLRANGLYCTIQSYLMTLDSPFILLHLSSSLFQGTCDFTTLHWCVWGSFQISFLYIRFRIPRRSKIMIKYNDNIAF